MSKRKHNTHDLPRMDRRQIQESNRLRLIALSTGWTTPEIAAVCKCHPDTIKQWLGERQLLNAERQAMLRSHWSAETGGPG